MEMESHDHYALCLMLFHAQGYLKQGRPTFYRLGTSGGSRLDYHANDKTDLRNHFQHQYGT